MAFTDRSSIAVAILWLGWAGALTLQAATEPYFSFTPAATTPGATITVAGSHFGTSSAGVSVSLSSATGQRTALGAAQLNHGSFTKSFTLPSNLAPGPYLVNAVDSALEAGINLLGPLTVVASSSPWFTFTPTRLAAGQSVTVSASGFPGSSTGAAAALISSTGQVTLLGSASLTGGAFTKSFVVPGNLPANSSYTVYVKDSAGHVGFSASGPLDVGVTPLSVPLGFYPVGAAANPTTNLIYLPNSGSDTASVLDGNTNSVTATVAVGRLPCAVGLNASTNRVYVANVNSNNVTVIDGSSNTAVATIPVGHGPCAVVAYPANNRIFVGNYSDNTVSVLDGTTNAVLTVINLPSLPAALGINTVTGRVYCANGYLRSVAVIDANTNSIIATLPVGNVPDAIAVNESTNRVYVANFFGQTVSVINGSTNSTIATIPVGSGPSGIAVDAGTNRVYVSNYMSGSVSVVDGATNLVIATMPVGKVPDGVAINTATHRVYIPNSVSNSVSVIVE
jgi:YVTN family beta-propeller protein